MKIVAARTAGFCFGVDRAVKIVYNKLSNRNNVVTLGQIIHNRNVAEDLAAKGCRAVDLNEVQPGQTVVIRAHGVGRAVYDRLDELGAEIVDATCPFVLRIQNIAREKSGEGKTVLIAGDPDHPEVQGIRGHCTGKSYVFADAGELREVIAECRGEALCVISQTTYNKRLWEQCRRVLEELAPGAEVFDTICSATATRQEEAERLSREADLMIIAGGKNSSNTRRLVQVCQRHCRTLHVEDSDELKKLLAGEDLKAARFIGISAGASTPGHIIKEVREAMAELNENIVEETVETPAAEVEETAAETVEAPAETAAAVAEDDEDFNFAEELEKTIKTIHKGKRVEGVVTDIKENGEVFVDIGTKHTGIIAPEELTDDHTKRPEDIVQVGETIQLIVLQTSDEKGTVELSKRRVDAALGMEKIIKAKEENATLDGVVKNVVKGGVIVTSNGVRVFIPASQAVPRGGNLEALVGQQVEFKILEVTEARQRAVGSIRAVERDKREAAKAKFFESAQAGDVIDGTVKSITDYGVFVDLGGVDGLIRRPDLSWKRVRHPSDVVSVGDKVQVTVKEVDRENGKVALSYKKDSDNPWKVFTDNYSIGQVVPAKIVSITSFGAFAQIIDGIDGLIHISQIANRRVENVSEVLQVGDEVEVKITDIDYDKRRISLSIRALLEDED